MNRTLSNSNYIRFNSQHAEHQHDERSPLIAPYMRSYAASRMGGESLHFYSPVESMNNSEDEQDHVSDNASIRLYDYTYL